MAAIPSVEDDAVPLGVGSIMWDTVRLDSARFVVIRGD